MSSVNSKIYAKFLVINAKYNHKSWIHIKQSMNYIFYIINIITIMLWKQMDSS